MSNLPPPPPGGNMPPPPVGGGMAVGGAKPDNYLVWAILSTLFCCLPFGIASIVFAAQVDGKWAAGDYAGAMESSEQAKRWAIVAAAVGIGVGVLYLVFVVIVAASGS